MALLNEKPISFIVCNYTPTTCYASKMGYYISARKNHANNLIMCEAIKNACENGYQFFEFGLTFTSSHEAWKNQFMAKKVPLRIYEKRYSIIRTFSEKVIPRIMWMSKNKLYLLQRAILKPRRLQHPGKPSRKGVHFRQRS